MKLLIGSTGLVGSTLKEAVKFDYEFNSKNLKDLLSLDCNQSDLYLSCLPATKWMVNKKPLEDFNNMVDILSILSTKQYNNIIIYSTIDIYQNQLDNVDETTTPPILSLNYGSIRLLFEYLIKERLAYNKLSIIRLPALYGKYIKKNVIYDLLNDNNISSIPWNSKFQWYNLDKLVIDTDRIVQKQQGAKVQTVNLFTEPIETSTIVELFGLTEKDVDSSSKGAYYNCQTIQDPSGFIESKDIVLQQLTDFIKKYQYDKNSNCI